jgi:hypothetical protein
VLPALLEQNPQPCAVSAGLLVGTAQRVLVSNSAARSVGLQPVEFPLLHRVLNAEHAPVSLHRVNLLDVRLN